MAKITFLVEEKCMASSIVGCMDAFSIANLWYLFTENTGNPNFLEWEIVSVDGNQVTANNSIPLFPVKSIADVGKTDLIMIPSFLPPFNFETPRIETICAWLKKRHKQGTLIATSCTGTFLLAKTGLLDGKIATTNWQFAGMFKALYPKVDLRIDQIMTEDTGLLCTGAATAFMNLCFYIIEKYGSKELAHTCAKALLVDPDRSSQSPYIMYVFSKNHNDDQILTAQKWMEDNFADKTSIDEVAENIGISPRHFKRRFKTATGQTPTAYMQRLRIEKAKQILEKSKISVNEITWQVGYEDINSFRKLFKKHTGMSPKEYRRKFTTLREQSVLRAM